MSTPDPVSEMFNAGAAPAADIDSLRAQLAAAEAAEAAKAAAAEEARPAPSVAGGSSELRDALDNLHRRLAVIEAHLGLQVADKALTLAVAGLAGMMLAEVPQVLSGFLPSPSTAYDKASGGIETGPDSMQVLRISEAKGTLVTVVMAGSVALMSSMVIGRKAWWLFGGAMGILVLFLHDFESAIAKGYAARDGGDYD